MGASDSRIYGPGYLLDREIILVTANYRLGVLGFLTLGKSGDVHDIQGNQGLWDQVEGDYTFFYSAIFPFLRVSSPFNPWIGV